MLLFTDYTIKGSIDERYLFWWTDVSFVPGRDDKLVLSVGVYQERARFTILRPCNNLNGLVYTITFSENISPGNTFIYYAMYMSDEASLCTAEHFNSNA